MKLRVFTIAMALMLPVPSLSQSKPNTIWRIGRFDGSSAEFNQKNPKQAVNFDVSRDTSRTSWYAFAPVVPTSKLDEAAAPRNVIFSITGHPGPAYRLKISVLIEHSSVPALRVRVNGRTGEFYLHPRLDYSMGDTSAAFDPAYAHADVDVDIPRAWLKSGEDKISLQPIFGSDEQVPTRD